MELETDRLILRPHRAEDLSDIQRYAVRPAFYRYLAIPAQTPETVAAFLEGQLAAQGSDDGNHSFVLEHKDLRCVIGSVRLGVRDAVHRHGDLGYALDSDHQGHGYMTEAVRAVLRMGFEQLALHRIWATADIRNKRSWHLLGRCGMKREGRLREHRLVRGRWRDSYLYSILETDERP